MTPPTRDRGAAVRVLLADDQALIRSGFAALITTAPDLQVVGQAGDGETALRQVRALRPDVVLMDIRMPGMDGIAACEAITAAPDLSAVRIIVLTTFEADEHVLAALHAGASGFLGKGVEPEDLLTAIRVVAAGEALLSPRATRGLIARYLAAPRPHADDPSPSRSAAGDGEPVLAALTEREREVVALVALGLSNEEIAALLVLSPLTVKTHVNRSMAKLSVRDRAQLVVLAYRAGLVHPGDEPPVVPSAPPNR